MATIYLSDSLFVVLQTSGNLEVGQCEGSLARERRPPVLHVRHSEKYVTYI